MKFDSLRTRFTLWLLAPLLVLLSVDGWLTHQRARATVDTAYDRTLLSSVKAISDGVRMDNGEIHVDLPYVALEMFESDTSGPVFYRVALADGTTLTGYDDLPLPKRVPGYFRPTYYDTTYRNNALRVAAIEHPVYDLSTNRNQVVWVAVAETTGWRAEIARHILIGSLVQEGVLALLALAAVWCVVTFAMRPLNRLSAKVGEGDAGEAQMLDEADAPREIRPLIHALNRYTSRMQQMLVARRRFFSDAAHQLKTPLAVLQAQSEVLLRDARATPLAGAVEQLHASTRQAAQGVAKLLSLSRLEPDSGNAVELATVDLHDVARRVALEWAPVADCKQIDLGFEGTGPAWIYGQPDLLAELLGNLIDNSIKYGRSGGVVTVVVERGERGVRLSVIDDGPGIAESEREKVFKRFYRITGSGAPGTGLGLTIVREIVRVHHAAVDLAATTGGGLTVVAVFPAWRMASA